ncbi:MAG: hypothetical protein QOC89_3040 [Paraburkholderia sp.]|nr:hypothetical protein [Paraburkholderia sp.]
MAAPYRRVRPGMSCSVLTRETCHADRLRWIASQSAASYADDEGAAQALSPELAPNLAPIDIRAMLDTHAGSFRHAGVLSVRSGLQWPAAGRAATRAIVVTVMADKQAALRAALPQQIDGVPIDVRAADAMQSMQALDPSRYCALAQARHDTRSRLACDRDERGVGKHVPRVPAARLCGLSRCDRRGQEKGHRHCERRRRTRRTDRSACSGQSAASVLRAINVNSATVFRGVDDKITFL